MNNTNTNTESSAGSQTGAINQAIRIAIITCSSTRTIAEDSAGAALAERIKNMGMEVFSHQVVDDERAIIAEAIVAAADRGTDIILTCGGSGLSMRDVTPEATADVCERNVPGIAEAMRAESLKITGRAMLSRAVAMQRGKCLVINLPGSQKAATECFDAISAQLEHAVAMSAGAGH
jgi:molybdenum cofactor synthesis domain-containing protein